jgi:hypothetical protein
MQKGYVIDSGPKLLNVKPVNQGEWLGECPYCGNKKLAITPIDIDFVYTQRPNLDNLPEQYKRYLTNMPNIVDAVLACIDSVKGARVLIECTGCHLATSEFVNRTVNGIEAAYVDKNKLKKYLQRHYNITDSFEV